MATLVDFLEKLAKGGAFEAKFDKAPKTTMEEFGLDADQRKLIHDGDMPAIRREIRKEKPGVNFLVFKVKMG